jgi:hypothetical protein
MERRPITAAIGGWVGLRAVMDALVKRKIPCTCRIRTPDLPARRLAAVHSHTWYVMKYSFTIMLYFAHINQRTP